MMDLVGETFQRFPDSSFATPADQQRFALGWMFTDVRVDLAIGDGARELAAAWRPDLIVNDSGDFVGPLVAASLGLPSATVEIGLLRRAEWVELSTRSVARHWAAAGQGGGRT